MLFIFCNFELDYNNVIFKNGGDTTLPGIKQQFEEIYITHYSRMKRFAQEYVIREEDAENIVQDIFMELWENRILLESHSNIFSFLFTNVKNRCIDYLRRATIAQRVKDKIQNEHTNILQMKLDSLEEFDNQIFKQSNIEDTIEDAINKLPERCRQIFVLNKIEGKKQRQIAEELGISIHTVESQMSIANKRLKELLKDLAPLLIFFLI